MHFPTLRAPAAQTHASSALRRGSCILQPSRTVSTRPLRCRQGIPPLHVPFFLPVWGLSCGALTALWLPWAACTAPARGVTAPRPRWLVLNTRMCLESRHRALFFLSGGAGGEGSSVPLLRAGGCQSGRSQLQLRPRTLTYQWVPAPSAPGQEQRPHWGDAASVLVPQSQLSHDCLLSLPGLRCARVTHLARLTSAATRSPNSWYSALLKIHTVYSMYLMLSLREFECLNPTETHTITAP